MPFGPMAGDNFFQGRERSQSLTEDQSLGRRKWLKVQNVLRGINLMKKNIVKTLQDPDEIVENINRSPRRRRQSMLSAGMGSFNITMSALDDIRKSIF